MTRYETANGDYLFLAHYTAVRYQFLKQSRILAKISFVLCPTVIVLLHYGLTFFVSEYGLMANSLLSSVELFAAMFTGYVLIFLYLAYPAYRDRREWRKIQPHHALFVDLSTWFKQRVDLDRSTVLRMSFEQTSESECTFWARANGLALNNKDVTSLAAISVPGHWALFPIVLAEKEWVKKPVKIISVNFEKDELRVFLNVPLIDAIAKTS